MEEIKHKRRRRNQCVMKRLSFCGDTLINMGEERKKSYFDGPSG